MYSTFVITMLVLFIHTSSIANTCSCLLTQNMKRDLIFVSFVNSLIRRKCILIYPLSEFYTIFGIWHYALGIIIWVYILLNMNRFEQKSNSWNRANLRKRVSENVNSISILLYDPQSLINRLRLIDDVICMNERRGNYPEGIK